MELGGDRLQHGFTHLRNEGIRQHGICGLLDHKSAAAIPIVGEVGRKRRELQGVNPELSVRHCMFSRYHAA